MLDEAEWSVIMAAKALLPLIVCTLAFGAAFTAIANERARRLPPRSRRPSTSPTGTRHWKDACKVLPAIDVANIAHGKLSMAAVGGEVHCEYVLELADQKPETYDFYLHPAEIIRLPFETDTPAEKRTAVPGLWDEASVGPQISGPGVRLRALHKGDMTIELQGPHKEDLHRAGQARGGLVSTRPGADTLDTDILVCHIGLRFDGPRRSGLPLVTNDRILC